MTDNIRARTSLKQKSDATAVSPHPRDYTWHGSPNGGLTLVLGGQLEQRDEELEQRLDTELRDPPPGARFLHPDEGLLAASPVQRGLKRFLDIVGATSMLALLAPLMLVIGLMVRATSPGPALFKQERVGRNGRRFKMFKFRTMCLDAEKKKSELIDLDEQDGPAFKIRHDPRVTRVGKYLRHWSLDELPQFLNVLRGEMTLVGPRPPLPGEVETYNVWERQRLLVKPGLTCFWQVDGRSRVDFTTWVMMDIDYIAGWSLGLDISLLAKTLPAVIGRDGAY